MPTEIEMLLGGEVGVESDNVQRSGPGNKIRISQCKLMEAFGGKSFYLPDGEDSEDSPSEDDTSLDLFGLGGVSEGGSTLTSVSTLTTLSGRTGRVSARNFPRRAKAKDNVTLVGDDAAECATVVTVVTADHVFNIEPSEQPEIAIVHDTTDTLPEVITAPKSKKKTKQGGVAKLSSHKPATPTRTKRNKMSKTVTSPPRRSRVIKHIPSAHVLPDGTLVRWTIFLEGGGYSVTGEEKERVKMFVKDKHRNTAFVSEAVKFHLLVREMRKNLQVDSARDSWTKVLPPKSADNFDFCCLFLMVATPNTPDEKIIEVFDPIMKQNYVTPEWVLEKGVEGIADALRVLGRQNMTAKYIVGIAEKWTGLSRNYRSLMDFPGVGAKVALVTISECFNLAQGVPCDVHMVRIFKALGWMPVTLDEDCLVDMENEKRGKKDDEYEVARASLEGWFPHVFWAELNQTYAGLGQLLRIDESRKTILNFVDNEARNWESKWRLTDLRAIRSLVKAYNS